jgi:hypothetical protein
MPSTIAWLDASRDEQRRMREVINLFTQSESRDELGIGQVRDSFSDRLFPGTSTLHTRARYVLLIPWCYREAARLANSGEDLLRRADKIERKLIVALNDAGAHDGLIGRQVLAKLKTLPSALYWSALSQWGVLVGGVEDELLAKTWRHEADELVERAPRMWNVPAVPLGFPDSADTLDLSYDEALWVREHMMSGSEGSMLALLLSDPHDTWKDVPAPWAVPVGDTAVADLLEHARLFSLVIQGAALSYNLALARRYEQMGLTAVETPVDVYAQAITDWNSALTGELDALDAWQLADMWQGAREHNPRISWATQSFVDTWVDLLRRGVRPDQDVAVTHVIARERLQKKTQSRLTNEKLLRAWSGASGAGRLSYRWSNVTRLLTDVSEGLQRAVA